MTLPDAKTAETKQQLLDLTDAFCDSRLNAEYKRLCRKMIERLARKRPPPILKGRLDIWAAGIVYAIGSANFLFDKSSPPYISAADLAAAFGVKPGSAAQKAAAIRDMFDLDYFGNTEFSTKRMKEMLAPVEEMRRQMEALLVADALRSEMTAASASTLEDGGFVDGDHPAIDRYYEIAEAFQMGGATPAVQSALEDLIRRDPDFYDSYIMLGSILAGAGRNEAAEALLDAAYQRALKRVTDADGNWPQALEWGWLENRHIIRTFLNKALAFWTSGDKDAALDLLRKLLRSNPGDNIGARDYILAIRMGLTFPEFEKKFVSQFGYDAMTMMDWFDKNAPHFPDEFGWWREAVDNDGA